MSFKLFQNIQKGQQSSILSNSLWGVVSNVLQNILFSIFFIILARTYSTDEFGNYVISNTIYSFVLGFSSLGLGHWFIREVVNDEAGKQSMVNKFFKMQILIGIIFMGVNVAVTYALYEQQVVRSLALVFGINIIFDNIINGIKYLNIANQRQRITFGLLILEALMKCMVSVLLLFYHLDVIFLSMILLGLRFITLNLFLNIGSSNELKLPGIIRVKVSWHEFSSIVLKNWPFIVISTLSIINWRIGNIFVSKMLTLKDVADFEVSFKLLSIAYLVPIVVATTLYPKLIKALQSGTEELRKLYLKFHLPFLIYGVLSFAFVMSFSDFFVPLLFGDKFLDTAQYCNQIFLVMLVFPSIFLQANVLLALKLERLDVFINLASVVVNVLICAIGLHYVKNLTVVNIAIFVSLCCFHLAQDFILVRRKVAHVTHVFFYYFMMAIIAALFLFSRSFVPGYLLFLILISVLVLVLIFNYNRIKQFYQQ